MNPEFQQRLAIALTQDQEKFSSNCIGTALYLAEIQEKDTGVNTHEAFREYFKKLPVLESAREGCLVAWNNGSQIVHCGVITSLEPLLVTHRVGSREEIQVNKPLMEIEQEYVSFQRKYYAPQKIARYSGWRYVSFCRNVFAYLCKS